MMLTMVSMGGTVTRIIVALTIEQSETALYHLHVLQILVATQNPFYCSSQLSMVHWLSSPIFPFFETKIFETDTETFFETKVFETDTETFFRDQMSLRLIPRLFLRPNFLRPIPRLFLDQIFRDED